MHTGQVAECFPFPFRCPGTIRLPSLQLQIPSAFTVSCLSRTPAGFRVTQKPLPAGPIKMGRPLQRLTKPLRFLSHLSPSRVSYSATYRIPRGEA